MNSELVLSVNAGSSSLKISLYRRIANDSDEPVKILLTASVSNITAPPAIFQFQILDQACRLESAKSPCDGQAEHLSDVNDHSSAFHAFLDHLRENTTLNPDSLRHICHRVVHGGVNSKPLIIDDDAYHSIEQLSDLAPLHNGVALSVIKACMDSDASGLNIAYFDTAFHTTIPSHISSYPINQEIAKQKGLKKYGFHGLSYAFILRSVSRHLQKPQKDLNLIVLHLGSGASACAIRNGQSFDTSMGLTPVHGLPGATRSGAIDPSLIFHYTNTAGRITHDKTAAINLYVTDAEDILNKQSGWKVLTGTTDFGKIVQQANLSSPNDPPNKYRLAYDIFADRILNYIGSYYLKLKGDVDAIVFSGGIGERSGELRTTISEHLTCLGFPQINQDINENMSNEDGVVFDIGDSTVPNKRILVCRTDEQKQMAIECALEPRFWTPT